MHQMPWEERVVSRGSIARTSRAILRCILRLGGQLWSVVRSEGGFKGIVLGLSRADVEWALQALLVPAQLVAFSPISTWVLGLSRDKLLKRMDLSEHHVSSATPILLCIWGFFALAFFLTVASFLGYALSASRVVLILLTVFLAAVAIAASVSSAVRRKGAGAAERATASPLDGLPWIPDIPLDIALWPEVAVVVLAVVLLGVLAAFVFFLVWLPILFLVISLITFGAWWRIHRATFVTAMEDRPPKLRGVGEDLLTRGAILSLLGNRELSPGGVGGRIQVSSIDRMDLHDHANRRRGDVSLHRTRCNDLPSQTPLVLSRSKGFKAITECDASQ